MNCHNFLCDKHNQKYYKNNCATRSINVEVCKTRKRYNRIIKSTTVSVVAPMGFAHVRETILNERDKYYGRKI